MKFKNNSKKNHLIMLFLFLLSLFDSYALAKLLTKQKFVIFRNEKENKKNLISVNMNNVSKAFYNRENFLKDNILKYKDIIVSNPSSSFLQIENRNKKDSKFYYFKMLIFGIYHMSNKIYFQIIIIINNIKYLLILVCEDIEERKEKLRDLIHVLNISNKIFKTIFILFCFNS